MMQISNLEKVIAVEIGTESLLLDVSMRKACELIPNSMLLALLRGAFAGFCRDFLDAANSGDLKILAKWWMVAYEGANAIEDKATPEQIEALKSFKLKVDEILNAESVESCIRPDFDKI